MKKREVFRKTKGAKESLRDVEYFDALPEAEKAWMTTFLRATVNNSIEDMATLVDGDIAKLATLSAEIFEEDHARRRDITYVGYRASLVDAGLSEMDSEVVSTEQAYRAKELENEALRCGRCFKKPCACKPDMQYPRYGVDDYTAQERTEDTLLSELELTKKMQAYDLLPYGTSPKGLQQGHAVKICLPFHLLQKAWGYVLDYRPLTGEYLVRSMSKKGLRNKDGSLPLATVVWVKADGLMRFKLTSTKVFEKAADTIKMGVGT